MRRMLFVVATICLASTTVLAKNYSRKGYIQKYKDLAVREMKRTGIPASITLAQGLLESGNGNSTLAQKANNHFGIKCHDWKGPKIKVDDDRKNECFRKYNNPYESYKDHSKFLTSRSRYAFLFKYKPDDYKRWAYGLKKAGYATDPKYAHRLIKIIEDEQLYKLDKKGDRKYKPVEEPKETGLGIDLFGTRLEIANGVHFIAIEKGDTFFSIEKNLGVSRKKLLRFNDLPQNYTLKLGQIMYLHNKKNQAARGYNFHRVKQGETLYGISQKYGVKLKKICKFNGIKKTSKIEVGEKIWLRKKKR